MKIVPLAERPDLAEQVSAWGFDEWGHLSKGQTPQTRLAEVRGEMNVDRIPVTFVALGEDGGIVGTAALIFDDLVGDPRNPWLASVYVPPEHRKKGIASALVRAVEGKARELGYKHLYLFTTSAPALYAGLGWRALEQRDYRGEHIQVMDKVL
jgi:N-acetylglutamate synthase-like GNAT family acetyltransferase